MYKNKLLTRYLQLHGAIRTSKGELKPRKVNYRMLRVLNIHSSNGR